MTFALSLSLFLYSIAFRDAADITMKQWGVPSGGDWGLYRGGAIFIEGAENVSVSFSTFTRIDGNGIFVSGYTRNVTIADNEFSWIGDSPMAAWGYTNGRSLSFFLLSFFLSSLLPCSPLFVVSHSYLLLYVYQVPMALAATNRGIRMSSAITFVRSGASRSSPPFGFKQKQRLPQLIRTSCLTDLARALILMMDLVVEQT